MDTILRILKAAGSWNYGLHLHIDNPPYMALVSERWTRHMSSN